MKLNLFSSAIKEDDFPDSPWFPVRSYQEWLISPINITISPRNMICTWFHCILVLCDLDPWWNADKIQLLWKRNETYENINQRPMRVYNVCNYIWKVRPFGNVSMSMYKQSFLVREIASRKLLEVFTRQKKCKICVFIPGFLGTTWSLPGCYGMFPIVYTTSSGLGGMKTLINFPASDTYNLRGRYAEGRRLKNPIW